MSVFYRSCTGGGHECAWLNITKIANEVKHENRYKEYKRVDRLIKQGALLSFKNDTVFRVKDFEYSPDQRIYERSKDKRYLTIKMIIVIVLGMFIFNGYFTNLFIKKSHSIKRRTGFMLSIAL